MPNNGSLEPGGPRARHTDHWSSKEAGRVFGGKKLNRHRAFSLWLIEKYPGSIYAELRRYADKEIFEGQPGTVVHKIRTAELLEMGLVHTKGYKVDPFTGRRCVRWWPGPPEVGETPPPRRRRRRRPKKNASRGDGTRAQMDLSFAKGE